jgi:hypothetical protein
MEAAHTADIRVTNHLLCAELPAIWKYRVIDEVSGTETTGVEKLRVSTASWPLFVLCGGNVDVLVMSTSVTLSTDE